MNNICDELRSYLKRTHAYAWQLAKKPDEPAIVHAFLADAMWPVLQEILRGQVKSKTELMVRGIFTHQTPTVQEVNKAPGCEIADLMLVKMHMPTSKNQKPYGKALLLQAKHKASPHTGSLTKAGDLAQFNLYKDWNPFNGTSRLAPCPPPPAVHGIPWNLRGTDKASVWKPTAEYLTVFKGAAFTMDANLDAQCARVDKGNDYSAFESANWPNSSPWSNGVLDARNMPSDGVACQNDFAETLWKFVEGKYGRSFNAEDPKSTDHWSIFVRTMLETSCASDYKFGKNNLPRSQTAMVSSFATVLPLVAEQQVQDFLADATFDGFEFINACLARYDRSSFAHQFKDNGPGQPREPDPREVFISPPRGHVPILLIVTYGEEARFTQ